MLLQILQEKSQNKRTIDKRSQRCWVLGHALEHRFKILGKRFEFHCDLLIYRVIKKYTLCSGLMKPFREYSDCFGIFRQTADRGLRSVYRHNFITERICECDVKATHDK